MTTSRSFRSWFVGLAVALATYALVGFLAVPAIIHRQIVQRGAEALSREVTLERVGFNPFTFVTDIERLRVAGREGDEVLLSVAGAQLNFDALESLFRWQWRFGDVTLTAPEAWLAVDENGVLNVADLLGGEEDEGAAEPGGIPRIGVDRLVVEGGALELADRSGATPFTSEVRPVAFALENFSTATGRAGKYQLSGSTRAGETFTWSGTLAAAPFASQGRIEITSIDVPSYQPFFARVLAGEVRSGRADLEANYDLALGEQRRALLREVKLRLTDVGLALPAAEQAALRLPSLRVEMPEADLFARSAHVTQVELDGLAISAVRENDGTLNLSRFLTVEPSGADDGQRVESQAGRSGPAFDVRIDRVALQNGLLQLKDHASADAEELQADQIVLALTDLSSDPTAETGVELALRWQEGPGTLNANGTLVREPFKANLQVTGSQLELAAASPYLRPFAEVRIVSGRAEFDGRLELSRAEAEALALRWTGRMSVDELVTRDRAFDHELVRWSKLTGEGIDFSLAPQRLAVQQLRLESPAFHVLLGPDGRTNLTAVFAGSAPRPAQPATSAPAAGATDESSPASTGESTDAVMPITLDNLVIAGGTITLTDRSGEEPMEARITAVEGTLSGLSTERNESGQLRLTASVLGSAPATLQGEVNVTGADVLSGTHLALDVKGVPLESLEPYVARFLGHRMERGRMQGDFGYKLSAGTLEGDNHVVLDDFYLGEPVESPDALAVPVKLALAVLRNREGQVVLDVPVSGSLKSPEFSFGDAIRGAFGNILGKIAAAPLTMLGSMFGAPETDLSQAEFVAGSTELTGETQRKLEVLKRALQERPGLKLMIEWQPTPEADRAAARQQRLAELVEQQRGRLAASIGAGEVTESQALRALYAERVLGESAPAGGPGPSTQGGPQSDADRAAWYQRFWQWFWGPWPEEGQGSVAQSQTSPTPPSAAPDISEDQMRQDLLASLELDDGAMEELARSRAEAAREQLVSAGISANRIGVSRQDDAAAADAANRPLIQFELAPAAGTALAE